MADINEMYIGSEPVKEMRFAKADMSMMSGKQTPSPVSAAAPSPGMWPMYIRSTTL